MSSQVEIQEDNIPDSVPLVVYPEGERCTLPNGERVFLVDISRVLLQSSQIKDLSLDGTFNRPLFLDNSIKLPNGPIEFDVAFSVDPGVYNAGIAMFIRREGGEIGIELATQASLTYPINPGKKTIVQPAAAASYIWLFICKTMTILNQEYMKKIDLFKPNRFSKVLIIYEQPALSNLDIRLMFASLLSCANCMAAFCPFICAFMTVSPQSMPKVWNLEKTSQTYAGRKRAIKDKVDACFGFPFPRHDITDAITLGFAGLSYKRRVILSEVQKYNTDVLREFFAAYAAINNPATQQPPPPTSSSSSVIEPPTCPHEILVDPDDEYEEDLYTSPIEID